MTGEQLTQLGQLTALPSSPELAVLERVENPHPNLDYLVRFTAPEFTSLCPKTGQPDFAHLVLDYVPRQWIVESKSLKLFLHSFRNHGAFHEDCTLAIASRIASRVRGHAVTVAIDTSAKVLETQTVAAARTAERQAQIEATKQRVAANPIVAAALELLGAELRDVRLHET